MALSDSIHDPGQGPGRKPLKTPKLQHIRVTRKHRQSLMHEETTTIATPDEKKPNQTTRIINTIIPRADGSSASCSSVLFDLSSRSETLEPVLAIVVRQYPENCWAKPHAEGPRAILEVFFEDENVINKALTTDLVFNNHDIIKACKSLIDGSKVLKVWLSELPIPNI